MKNMIPIFQLESIGLIFLNLLISTYTYGKNMGNDTAMFSRAEIITEELLNFPFYSRENKQEFFSENTNYVMVLKNNRNCMNCFEQLNEYVHLNKEFLNAKFIVMALIDSTSLDRKRSFYENKKLMPDFEDVFFQYRGQMKSTIFDFLQSNTTPELLIINKGKIYHIPYSKIFDYPSLNISLQVQTEIAELLK